MQQIRDMVDDDCSLTLKELQVLIEDMFGVQISKSTIANYIVGWRYSLKRITVRCEASFTPELELARRDYSMWVLQQVATDTLLIYLDEVGFKVNMRRFYGRSPKGVKAIRKAPSLHSKNISVIAAMGKNGILHYSVLDGNCNQVRFSHFIDDLATRRDAVNMGATTTVIMDNMSAHRTGLAVEMLEIRGFRWRYLPQYSPFHNPIEMMFAQQWKSLIRSIEPTNEEELLEAIQSFVLTPLQAQNYIGHAHKNAINCLAGLAMDN